jgi:anti-anti-sigma factor
LELHAVTFLDSAGIRALLMCHSDAEKAGCQLGLTRTPPRVYEVLNITGLLDHFGLTPAPGSTGGQEMGSADHLRAEHP